MRLAPLLLPCLCFIAQAPEPKKDPTADGWTGQKVMSKTGVVTLQKFAMIDEDGEPVYTTTVGLQPEYLVRSDRDDRVLLRTRDGTEGWVEKDALVSMKEAEEFFTNAIDASPDNALYYQLRAHARRAVKNDLAGAIRDLSEAIRIEPESPELLNHRSLLWIARKEPEKALADIEEALRLKPDNAAIRCNRASMRAEKGEYAEAIADFDEAQKSDPRCASAHNGLAWLLATCSDAKFRDGNRALKHAEKAVELTERKIGSYVDTLAAAYAEVNRFDDAVRAQQESLADRDFLLSSGNDAHRRMELYRQRKAYREK